MNVFILPISNSPWSETDANLLQFVSEERQNKIMKYRFDIDKKLSLYSALLTRIELSKLTKIPYSNLLFEYTANNKPKLISTQNYYFNFSHTKNCILLCISSVNPIGADIELIDKAPLEIIENTFHSFEQEFVHQSLQDKNTSFFKIWTRKEAYTKFLGVGLNTELTEINTLSPEFEDNFYSWKHDNYMCSIYSPKDSICNIKVVDFDYLKSYFL